MKIHLQVKDAGGDGIVDWSSFIGMGPESYDLGYSQDEANSGYAHMLVNTSSFEVNQRMINRLDEYCFNSFPNADIKVGPPGAGGGGTPIEIFILGNEPDSLMNISEKVKIKLTGMPGTKNVKDDWGPKIKKFVIDIYQDKAMIAGISNQDIATSLRTVLDGFTTGGIPGKRQDHPHRHEKRHGNGTVLPVPGNHERLFPEYGKKFAPFPGRHHHPSMAVCENQNARTWCAASRFLLSCGKAVMHPPSWRR